MKPLTEIEQQLLAEIKQTFAYKPFDTTDITLAALDADINPGLNAAVCACIPTRSHTYRSKSLRPHLKRLAEKAGFSHAPDGRWMLPDVAALGQAQTVCSV